MPDQRDGTTWVALELTPHGEKLVEDGVLEAEIRQQLGVDESWPLFIPSRAFVKNGKRVVIHLMEGYAFVSTGLDEVRYFRLEGTKSVQKVMSSRGPRGIRRLETISDAQITELRARLAHEVAADITEGMKVLVNEGIYSKLEGTVLDIEGDHAVVLFELRSLKVMAKVPRVFLEAA